MLDGIEADGATCDRISHGSRHVLDPQRLHQTQHLHELALALLAHACLEQPAQGGELVWQLPVGERGSLVERIDLLLDQRQVVQRVVHKVFPLIGARMPRDDLRAAGDDDLVHVAAHDHLAMPEARRHGVVVAPVAHQRQRRHAHPDLLAGVVGRRQRLAQRGQIPLQTLADRLSVTAQALAHALAAARKQVRVQCLEAVEHGDRHQEVATRVADQPLDLALVVTLARAANRSSNR